MTLGEKLVKMRKEENYTQEQLAEILKVSRQSVSKWETDLAYPETEKLIELGKLFNCSMDYLLKDEIIDKNGNELTRTETNPEKFVGRIKSFLRQISLSRIIDVSIKIIGFLIAVDVIAAIIYMIVSGRLY